MKSERQVWNDVHDRVLWWVNDMSFRPPEINWEHYYECMAQDIADWAVDNELGELSAMDRLDAAS